MSCRDRRPDFSLSSATQLLGLEYKSFSFSFKCLPQQPLFPGMHRQLQEGTKLVQPCKLSLQLPAPLFGCYDLMALPESRCHLIAVLPSLGTWKGAHIPWWRIQHGCVKYRAGPANCCEAAPAVLSLPIQQLWGCHFSPSDGYSLSCSPSAHCCLVLTQRMT